MADFHAATACHSWVLHGNQLKYLIFDYKIILSL
jgi:hypothetical protein